MTTLQSRPPSSPASLTQRECDVIRLIAAGHTNAEIARELFLSVNSVKTYVRKAYRKIGARNRSHAVIWAYRNGFWEAREPDSRRSQTPG